MIVKKFLSERRSELIKELNPECLSVFNACYDFIEMSILSSYISVSPEVVRKIELLEALLFGFIEHSLDLNLLDEIEQQISTASMRGSARQVRTTLQ